MSHQKPQLWFGGRPVEDMTREELIAALYAAAEQAVAEREQDDAMMRLMAEKYGKPKLVA